MGATIGAAVTLSVTGRLSKKAATAITWYLHVGTLSFCTILCWQIDLSHDLFGGFSSPMLFIVGGLLSAAISGFLYVWLLHSRTDRQILILGRNM